MRISSRQALWLTGLVLVFQHLVLFAPHYMGNATFFRDFTNIYYPLTAFWLGWIKEGVFPHWAPYANMGLPFVLTMQSGIFYPPFWVFAWQDSLSYTLHMANIVMALHVLFGAWGAWCYARLLGLSRGPACFVAVAFQFMGCIYTNLQHPDMIRAYAWLPWLFWSAHVNPRQPMLDLRQWALPMVICLFVTGSYQGNLIAQSFLLTVFCLLSWLRDGLADRHAWARITALYARMGGLALLGLLLAAVYLWPTYELMDYQTRSSGASDFRHYWSLSYWHTFVMPSNIEGVYAWWAMIPAFITVPAFCMLFFTTCDFVRRQLIWVGITLFAVAMAAGYSLPFYGRLVDIFPMLGYSRLLSSDYRGVFCFGLILLSGILLERYERHELHRLWRSRTYWIIGLLTFYFLFGSLARHSTEWIPYILQADSSILLFAVGAMTPLLFFAEKSITTFYWPHWVLASVQVLAVLGLLYAYGRKKVAIPLAVILTGMALLSGFIHWYVDRARWLKLADTDTYYECLQSEKNLPAVLNLTPSLSSVKPACEAEGGGPLDAYLCGEYRCNVKDALNVTPRVTVEKLPGAYNFMIQPPRAALVAESEIALCNPAQVPEILLRSAPVQQVAFGLQDVHYQVHATENFCFVENELYFPGWSGKIDGEGQSVEAHSLCGALRSWCLPAGEYRFETRYKTPGLRAGAWVSVMALMLYAAVFGAWFVRRRTHP